MISLYEEFGVDLPITFIGIDPGVSGGIAWRCGNLVEAVKMPETIHDTVCLLRRLTDVGVNQCVIERVSAMPKQGVSSTFKFGRSYGALEGSVAALAIPYELVAPSTWQKAMGCLTKGDKNVTKRLAQQRWPHVKVTHAVADALLIADYCERRYRSAYGGHHATVGLPEGSTNDQRSAPSDRDLGQRKGV